MVCWLAGVVCGALAGGRNPPLTTAELLVDLARDYALRQRGQQTASDVQHVRALLTGAVRVDPGLTDAYVWLYDLAALSGDQTEAARILAALLKADPTHQGAFAHWLEAGVRAQQTVEKRVEWLQAVAATGRPPALAAMVHVALARQALERLDSAEARRQVARALELEPASTAAATLAVEALDEDADAGQRLRAALRVLCLNPASVQAAWQAGLILDQYGFAEEAGRFYEHALAVHWQVDPHGPVPGGFLLALARNLHARGQVEAAVERARQAVSAEPQVAGEAGLFLHYLLRRDGQHTAAEAVREQLAKRFAAIREPAEWPVNEVAQAAWFYSTIEPQPDRALMLATAAAERASADVFVQRVLGWARAINRRSEEAYQTLLPIAGRDPYAAHVVARLLRETGDEAGARRVVENLEPMPTAGPALDLLQDFLRQGVATQPATSSQPVTTSQAAAASRPAVTSQPARRRYPGIGQALAEFDERVLEFQQAPARFLVAQVELDNRSLMPAEPWWAVFTLTNRGPFPITLGPDAMLNPVFVLSFTLEGDRKRDYPALLTIGIDRVGVLGPGESVRVRRTISVGPLRRVARQTPQHLQRVSMSVLLDAELTAEGEWRPSLGGQALRPVYFNRLPAGTGREALNALFSALTGGTDVARVQALEVLAELLGECQRARLRRLEYQPGPVPAERIRAGLLNLLGSESWELRVRTLDALQVVGLNRPLVAAVEGCLEHPHWLVRMMALRVLGRQGARFAERAASVARNDPDELVRAFAQTYVEGHRVEEE